LALAILIILLVGLGVACLLWLPRGRKVGRAEPRCAACGYIVHGLPEPICPECGSDLSQPNAIVRSTRLPPGRLARSIAWTLFCLLAVMMPLMMAWQVFAIPRLPRVYNGSRIVTFSYPDSQAYLSIRLEARSHRHVYEGDPDPPPDELKIQLARSDHSIRELAIDPPTLRFRDTLRKQNQWSANPLDADALVAWLKNAGVQAPAENLQREMQIVMTQIPQMHTGSSMSRLTAGSGFSGVSSTSGSSMNPLPWAGLPPLVAAAIIWAIGVLRIGLARR